ncbi:MAG: protein kinase family protein [Deltaproteobacteria bacterium]|nr:protein kinase family protein [Deltaproteobacteria bacterium]
MSFLAPVDCPRCGAPLPPEAIGATVATCPYCDGTLAADPRVVWSSAYRRALADAVETGVPLLNVGNVAYVVEGRFARGESSDVFLARRAIAPTERVLVKVLRAEEDADLLEREWSVLSALHDSDAPGAAHFTGRLPQLVARGAVSDPGRGDHGTATVMRFQSGFVHTLDDVRAAHGDAIDPRHAVWIWRRVLELLTWVHAHGVAHGAILPQHLVIHARDHGVLIGAHARAGGDAGVLERLVVRAARAAFGPPTYVPLRLP